MRQLDYVGFFWKVLSVQCAMGLAAFVLLLGFLWLNRRQTVTAGVDSLGAIQPWRSAQRRADSEASAAAFVKFISVVLKSAFGLIGGVIALLFAVSLFAQWGIGQAREQFEDVEKAAGLGDWAKFGGAMDKLKCMLANPPPVAPHD